MSGIAPEVSPLGDIWRLQEEIKVLKKRHEELMKVVTMLTYLFPRDVREHLPMDILLWRRDNKLELNTTSS